MLFATRSHHIIIDREPFKAFCEKITGPGLEPPRLIPVLNGRKDPFGKVVACYNPSENSITINEEELGWSLAEHREEPVDRIVAIILTHEFSHYVCEQAPHVSRWSMVHNGAQSALKALLWLLPGKLPFQGPGASPWLLIGLLRWMREYATDKLGSAIYREHYREIHAMIHVI